QVRWVARELCAAAGLAIADGAPVIPLDPTWDLRAAAATLARTEELGGAADEHGRFPASASALGAGATPLDEMARAPLHRLLGSDPNWSHKRFAASEQRHGFRSTCFVLAAHRDPHDGAAPGAYAARRARLVTELDALGLEVGLHSSYTCLADERLVAGERAVLSGLLGGPIAGNRHHYLRLPWHEGIRTLDRLGFSYDTTLGYAERTGP